MREIAHCYVVLLLLIAVLMTAAPASADSIQERLGHPLDARLLMIHADDLGISSSPPTASTRRPTPGLRERPTT